MPKQTLKQRSDKRFRAWYKGKQFYGDTQRAARAKRDEYKRQVEAGINVAEAGIRTGDYCDRWITTYKASVTDRTKAAYRTMLGRFCRFQIKKVQIGNMPLKAIAASDIQSFYNSLAGLSYSSVTKYAVAIRSVFRSAIADRIIVFDPTTTAKPPKSPMGSHRAITQEERQLIHAIPHPVRICALVMLYAGLRKGEVIGLDVDRDVDFGSKLIHVRGAVSWTNSGAPIHGTTKTAAGIRAVPLLGVIEPELRKFHGPLVVCKNRSVWDTNWRGYMKALSAAAGKEIRIQPHDLRHTFCTMLYDAGVDIKSAQAWMGHAKLEITLSVYTHLSTERKKAATDALEKAAKSLATVQNAVQSSPESSENADR